MQACQALLNSPTSIDRKRGYCNFLLTCGHLGNMYHKYIFYKLWKEGFCKFHLVNILRIFWKYIGNTLGKKGGGALRGKSSTFKLLLVKILKQSFFCKMKIFNKGNHFLDWLVSLAMFCPASADRAKPRAFQSISKHIRKWSEYSRQKS